MPKATFYTHVSHAEAFNFRQAQRAVQSGRVLATAAPSVHSSTLPLCTARCARRQIKAAAWLTWV